MQDSLQRIGLRRASVETRQNLVHCLLTAGTECPVNTDLAAKFGDQLLRAAIQRIARKGGDQITGALSCITITGSNGHDYLLHLTQFLFFLQALDCTDADQISNFIEAHNQKIESEISDPGFTKSKNEFRKAIIRPERKAKILDTIRTLRRPVFAIYEFGHLLIDDMSPKTTEKLIEDLRHGNLLVRRIDDRISVDQKRVLIASSGFLEDTYRTSLLMQRRMIAHSMSEAEFHKAKT